VPRFLPRFSVRQRCEHAIVMSTFIVLIATGLPQKFHDAGWASTMVGWFGGIDMMRLIHRVAGWVFAAAAVLHFFTVGGLIILGKMKMSMVPKLKDFRDAITSLRFYLGSSPAPPRADRFDHRQKFEYWGMVLGGVIMAVSGAILIYPLFFATYLPGQLIPVAKTVHTYEAVMALLTIIIWHMYGARFDPSIFTGKIAAEKLAHHHPIEYERIVQNLDEGRAEVTPPAGPVLTPTASTSLRL
jgi:formate dehydrogenase gamma subunit